MRHNPYDHFGIPETINCAGFATRVGGSCPVEEVLNAMREAGQRCVEIDDLQTAASELIARTTGAEAGLVTCGAAAALTLSAAACLVGANIEWMERLPDTAGLARNEIIYPRSDTFGYDHPIRAAGARLREIDYQQFQAPEQIESAIGPQTAAIGYAWYHIDESPPVNELAALAHRHQLPLIVDAAMSLPPVDNLTHFIEAGADLVAFSGGKHLGGPGASGILCGQRNLIRSAWVQMVDLDVRQGTWTLQRWVDEGWISRPPRHGIGRSMKAGKEAIIGLMTALEMYRQRNHAAELGRWQELVTEIAAHLAVLPTIQTRILFPSPTGQPFPTVEIFMERNLQNALRAQRPKIILAEHGTDETRAYIYPMCLKPEDPKRIATAFASAIQMAKAR